MVRNRTLHVFKWDKEITALFLGTGVRQKVIELKWLRIGFYIFLVFNCCL